jgi:alkanesulfonate monooxygenase
VAAALRKYADLGITHFIISDAPYLRECARIGDELLPRLRASLAPALTTTTPAAPAPATSAPATAAAG